MESRKNPTLSRTCLNSLGRTGTQDINVRHVCVHPQLQNILLVLSGVGKGIRVTVVFYTVLEVNKN